MIYEVKKTRTISGGGCQEEEEAEEKAEEKAEEEEEEEECRKVKTRTNRGRTLLGEGRRKNSSKGKGKVK